MNDRRGRKPREATRQHRQPQMPYYLILTDEVTCPNLRFGQVSFPDGKTGMLQIRDLEIPPADKTEENYLNGLKDSVQEGDRGKIRVNVIPKVHQKEIVEKAKNERARNPNYSECWIVMDRDKVPDFDEIQQEAVKAGIRVGWSNPCIEIWFMAYYGSMRVFADSTSQGDLPEFSIRSSQFPPSGETEDLQIVNLKASPVSKNSSACSR